MNDDGHFKGGDKTPLLELAKHHKIHFHIAIPLQEDIYIYLSQMARDAYQHPLKINFNICSRAYS